MELLGPNLELPKTKFFQNFPQIQSIWVGDSSKLFVYGFGYFWIYSTPEDAIVAAMKV